MTILITIDDRERQSSIEELLKKYDDVETKINRLSMGDYLVNNQIIFERKTFSDFAASIIDGRLFKQILFLTKSKYKCALILEGDRNGAEKLRISREAIQGALITLSLIFDIPILRSKNQEETARLIVYTARQMDSIAKGSMIRKGRAPKRKRKLQLFILQGLPGIGIHRAEQLLETFETVENVMTASSGELTKIPGIGKKIAKKIRWIVGDQKTN